MPSSAREHRSAAARFGTFGGVFTPCVLTILGVIMFLRFGEVVGNAGVLEAVAIVLAAKLITLLTGFSLAAIATNTRTAGGGAYFLISRSLGVEFGGTIGIVFFIAQAISVAMYVIGFSEVMVDLVPALSDQLVPVATAVNAAVFVCVYIGAGWTIRVQYVILGVLALSILSFVGGTFDAFRPALLRDNLMPEYRGGESLVTMFALFFPAVTGIMAGANMSGDLKDPGRSIPRGTIAAILVTAVVYLVLAVLLGGVAPRGQLIDDSMVMHDVSMVPWLVTAGVFAATLSSALGSMMGSPRILQAVARDQVLPFLRPFASGSGAAGEPRRAVILTFIIAQGGVMIGDLNAIAPIITMAFMITYGTLCLATTLESLSGNPSYRPRFRLNHWSMSALGTLLCAGVMLLISWQWAITAILLMLVLHRFIAAREIEANWGDLRGGLAFERARRNLLTIEALAEHPKNWRPLLLTLTGAADRRRHLAVFGQWLTAGHGVQSLGLVIEGRVEDLLDRRAAQKQVLRRFMQEESIAAFPVVCVSPTLEDGITSLVQCHGLGGLEPNTVMLGWPEIPERWPRFCSVIRTIAGLDRSVLVVRSQDREEHLWRPPLGTIDVWWRGRDNGPLMVLLAHLLTRNPGWRGRTVRLMRVVEKKEAQEEVLGHLEGLINEARIRGRARCVVDTDPLAAIRRESARAAVTILGFEPPADDPESEQRFMEGLDRLTAGLPRVILVDSAGGVELAS
jgi:amino acid transporter